MRLDKVEYGKEEVAKIVPKDEATLIQTLIDVLQERLKVLKSSSDKA